MPATHDRRSKFSLIRLSAIILMPPVALHAEDKATIRMAYLADSITAGARVDQARITRTASDKRRIPKSIFLGESTP